jgi:hypothetical protein
MILSTVADHHEVKVRDDAKESGASETHEFSH